MESMRLGELRGAIADGREMLSVHYACESLAEATDHPPAVSCIAVANLKDGTRTAFSQADTPPNDEVTTREVSLFKRFYGYMMGHQDSIILHWNMNNSTYGFVALANRYRFLVGEEPQWRPVQHLLYDVDTVVSDVYGAKYIQHPKMYNLASLNRINLHSFLKAADEIDRFKQGDFGAISNSTLTKARVILDILSRVVNGTLQTQNSAGSVSFAGTHIDVVETVLTIGQRMRDVERELARRHASRDTLVINDEYDAQDLLKALLKVFFDDVRPEQWTPSYAGSASRIDFVIPAHELAIEVKHSRNSMSPKSLGDELIVDRDRYKTENRAKHLICLVFDYRGLLPGARGLENDLTRETTTEGLAVTVRIFDR